MSNHNLDPLDRHDAWLIEDMQRTEEFRQGCVEARRRRQSPVLRNWDNLKRFVDFVMFPF